jgi:hypothetical protein
MTRSARNHPVQLIPSDRELAMLADLRLWWGERHASNVLRTLLVTAWAAEQAKRQAGRRHAAATGGGMNEQLAAIRARRDAAEYTGNGERIFVYPADVDTLLAEVERLTGERDEYRTAYLNEQKLSSSYHVLWQTQEDDIARLTVERDALAAELATVRAQLAQAVDVRSMSVRQLQVIRDAATNRLYEVYCAELDGKA